MIKYSRIIEWLITAVFAALLGWLGIERHRNRQKDQELEKQVEIYKTFIEQTQHVQEAVHEIAEEQKIEEEKIEQTETVDDIIAAANDIVSRFNAGRM